MLSIETVKQKISLMGMTYHPGNASRLGHTYNPIPFPAFKDIPNQRPSVYERLELMQAESGSLLDIGCHTGFNCFEFEKQGFECTGIEAHTLTCEIAADVALLHDSSCDFINAPVSVSLLEDIGRVDVCLFLSTFQWVTLAEGFASAKDILKAAIDLSGVLFFETSMGDEGKAKMPMLPDKKAVADMLREFGEVENLGSVAPPGAGKRYIFKCW